jgi:hypothetical protein
VVGLEVGLAVGVAVGEDVAVGERVAVAGAVALTIEVAVAVGTALPLTLPASNEASVARDTRPMVTSPTRRLPRSLLIVLQGKNPPDLVSRGSRLVLIPESATLSSFACVAKANQRAPRTTL